MAEPRAPMAQRPSPRAAAPGRDDVERPEELHSELAELRAGLAELRADHDALLACLERLGLPGTAHVRRERAARETARAAALLDGMLVQHCDPAARILAYAGPLAWAATRRASRAALQGADAVREEKIYAVGGLQTTLGRDSNLPAVEQWKFGARHQLKSTEVLDVESGEWQPGVAMSFGSRGSFSAALGGFLYVFGGMPPLCRTMMRFNPVHGKWNQLPNMPTPRVAGQAVALPNCIYLLGGIIVEPIMAVLSSMVCYQPGSHRDKGTWTQLPDMPMPRRDFGAAVHRGKVVLCGGCNRNMGEEHLLNPTLPRSVDAFCPTSHSWEPLPLLLEERAEPAACSWQDKLYVCGGSVPLSGHVHTSVEVYEPSSRAWSIFSNMLVPRKVFGAVAASGQLYLFGGFCQLGMGEAWTSVESMDAASGTSRQIGHMDSGRGAFAYGMLTLGPSAP